MTPVLITVLVFGVLVGLGLILLPRGLMLVGTRWTLRDGEAAEPSDAYVLYVRVVGVVFLVATVGVAWWLYSLQAQQAERARHEELWNVDLIGDAG
ncbi:hypothetical protein KSI86_20875, partial [Dickeya oryzae]|uniref:DUF6199 family natural product biosynthesis protein n=1 Tax=Dickeya oryzae TaxID=1240404 RepID=UPI002096EDF5